MTGTRELSIKLLEDSLESRAAWNSLRQNDNARFEIPLLPKKFLSGYTFDGYDFSGTTFLSQACAQLKKAEFNSCTFKESVFDGAKGWRFYHCNFRNAHYGTFHPAKDCEFEYCKFDVRTANNGLHLGSVTDCLFKNSTFNGGNMAHKINCCDFIDCDLIEVVFSTEMDRCNFRKCEFESPYFEKLKIAKCTFEEIAIAKKHDAMTDRGLNINLALRDSILNWERLRLIGKFPLFSVSWSLLGITAALIAGIAWLDESRMLTIVQYPIGIPWKLSLLLLGSFLLAVGSTFYAVYCPNRIQTYNATQWVNELNRSGFLYVAGKIRRPGQEVTAVSLLSGGLILLWLSMDRVGKVLGYLAFKIFS